MCGRFTLQITPEMLAEIFGLSETPQSLAPRYNIAPTQQIPIIRQLADSANHLSFAHWGLIPSWAKDKSIGNHMINARAETVHEKPSFRHAVKYRRCLIPSSGFFEWRKDGNIKIPLYIHLKDSSPMVYAGLWESWKSPEGDNLESCTILTTAANKLIEPLHDRMPVILHPQEYNHWLNRDITDPAEFQTLYHPYPAETMDAYEVSTEVNNPRNDSPSCIAKV